ncbi:MAG: hypothetical protein KKG76_01330 [Euryarchaeota archaeon]|nr:hypothetical protein [Euryarchaeota archaeon]
MSKTGSNNKITRDAVKTELSDKYVSGTLTKADLKKVVMAAYNRNLLNRDDLRWLLGQMYKEGKLTRADLRWVLTEAYKNGELTRDDIRRIIIVSYNHRELTRDDVKWLLMQAYKNNELTREDIRLLITAAYRQGELTRADVKWLIVEGYKARELTRDDLRWILLEAIKHGELRKTDVVWIVNEGYQAKELTTSDITEAEVNSAPVDSEPAYVPTVETITEPNAETAGQSQRFANAIRVARDIISKSETALDGFEKRGVDVSAEKAGLEEIKGIVDSAETKYKAGDYTGAQQDLKKAQEMFKDIRSKAVSRRNTR